MKRTERLTVTYHGRTVGTLTMTPDRTRCAFAYDKEACTEILAEEWTGVKL